eukprot:scaffold56167_cov63-Phaeocystis_antarctica.AAC.6
MRKRQGGAMDKHLAQCLLPWRLRIAILNSGSRQNASAPSSGASQPAAARDVRTKAARSRGSLRKERAISQSLTVSSAICISNSRRATLRAPSWLFVEGKYPGPLKVGIIKRVPPCTERPSVPSPASRSVTAPRAGCWRSSQEPGGLVRRVLLRPRPHGHRLRLAWQACRHRLARRALGPVRIPHRPPQRLEQGVRVAGGGGRSAQSAGEQAAHATPIHVGGLQRQQAQQPRVGAAAAAGREECGERRLGRRVLVLNREHLGATVDVASEQLVHGSQPVNQLILERIGSQPRLSRGDVGDVKLRPVLAHKGSEEREHLLDGALVLARGDRREDNAFLLEALVDVGLLGDDPDGPDDCKGSAQDGVGHARHHVAARGGHLLDADGELDPFRLEPLQLRRGEAVAGDGAAAGVQYQHHLVPPRDVGVAEHGRDLLAQRRDLRGRDVAEEGKDIHVLGGGARGGRGVGEAGNGRGAAAARLVGGELGAGRLERSCEAGGLLGLEGVGERREEGKLVGHAPVLQRSHRLLPVAAAAEGRRGAHPWKGHGAARVALLGEGRGAQRAHRAGELLGDGVVDLAELLLRLRDLPHRLGLQAHRTHLRPEAPLEGEALARAQRRLLGGGGLGEAVVEALQLCVETLDGQVLLRLLAEAERLGQLGRQPAILALRVRLVRLVGEQHEDERHGRRHAPADEGLREEDDDLAAVVRLEEGADQGQAAALGEHRQRRASQGSSGGRRRHRTPGEEGRQRRSSGTTQRRRRHRMQR